MKVTQHRPDFISDSEPPWRGEVESVQQLILLPFVQKFLVAPGFYQFSVARDHPALPALLMAEFGGGERAYVVARISGPEVRERLSALPTWQEGRASPPAPFKPVVTNPLGPPLDE